MTRIEDYAILGDLHTAALVGTNGSIDWLCLPNFDSPACFAALLDSAKAGRWLMGPASGGHCSSRRYRPGTLILESEWHTDDGSVRITDFMPARDETVDVVRIVEGLSGTVPMRAELVLRFDYGHIVPWVRRSDDRLIAIAGPDSVYVDTPAPLHGEHMKTVSEFSVKAGQRIPFVLSWLPSHQPAPQQKDAESMLKSTDRFWTDWSSHSQAAGPYAEAIQRSLITLKALTFIPTGGITAAATTSLPEQLGGPRNWDYRYGWLRDSTLALQSLLAGGYTEEAMAWRDWLLRAAAGDPGDLQIMYGLDGRRRLPETTIDWLSGYEGSAPVRIGNAASQQFQLDVWGEVLDGLSLTRNALPEHEETPNKDAWSLQLALMDHLGKVWKQPDNGLWEMRGPRRHFTYSKVMVWVGADRMIQGVEDFGLPGPVDAWRRLRDRVRADILKNGFNTKLNSFVQSYGSENLDASLLLIPRVRFLPPDDDRVLGTIDAVKKHLMQDGFVLRYRAQQSDDGLPGSEGVFLACSFWLVDALAGAGRRDEAVELFERLLTLRNDVGLLSEEWDTKRNRQLGNTPQAFSHYSLITSAFQLHHGRADSSNKPIHKGADGKDEKSGS
ncbi:MAG TPA: glycoside hydrolase family 15 protein [Humibacter sp.]|nr:glycoside hydrolase family 15 protein [Humibacter sp.]